MEWCPRVLGWLLAEELAAGNDEDVPAAQREPAARIVAMERCFARMDVEVTSAGERTSCRAQRAEQIEAALPVSRSSAVGCAKTGAGSGLPAARTSRSGRRRRSGSPSPCSDSPLLGLLGGSSRGGGGHVARLRRVVLLGAGIAAAGAGEGRRGGLPVGVERQGLLRLLCHTPPWAATWLSQRQSRRAA
ncbi:hypothetical protein PVAP13_5NG087281 [Panicum virgatum]|uniref:Uncharacterized protein n=1 Tax=Panicum virgatum TaxID=38727 RepID=A0A8T0RLK6_PANVG|nr:hypothetical protein PVAP13_5NG087281 [Panicum virgatum]